MSDKKKESAVELVHDINRAKNEKKEKYVSQVFILKIYEMKRLSFVLPIVSFFCIFSCSCLKFRSCLLNVTTAPGWEGGPGGARAPPPGIFKIGQF